MRKLINTFKYSSLKAKLILACTLLAGLAGVGLVVASILTHMTVLFFGAVMCGFGAMALAQTFAIDTAENSGVVAPGSDVENMEDVLNRLIAATDTGREVPDEVPDSRTDEVPDSRTDEVPDSHRADEVPDSHRDEVPDSRRVSGSEPETTSESTTSESGTLREPDTDADNDDDVESGSKSKKKKKKFSLGSFFKKMGRLRLNFGKRKKKPVKEEVKEEPKQGDVNVENWFRAMEGAPSVEEEYRSIHVKDTGVPLDELEQAEHDEMAEKINESVKKDAASVKLDEEEDPKNLVVVRQATEEDFKKYDRKTIKKTMHRYKVKRDHRLVMIDRCDKLAIKQTPAYVWVKDKDLNILLIEQEPRHIVLPTFRMREMIYLKKQIVNEDVDYGPFKGKSILAEMFRPYLPDYSHSTVVDDLSSYKNLYGFGPDIFVTNRSAKQIFDLLPLTFRVDDKVTLSAKVNNYFKDTYKANILLRDNVIDANGYADRIASILDGMAHSTISYNEFKETLNLMVKNKLITQEFAQYYMSVRDKVDTHR